MKISNDCARIINKVNIKKIKPLQIELDLELKCKCLLYHAERPRREIKEDTVVVFALNRVFVTPETVSLRRKYLAEQPVE